MSPVSRGRRGKKAATSSGGRATARAAVLNRPRSALSALITQLGPPSGRPAWSHAQLRGRPRPVNDSWIAACYLVRELPLATFNIKDYADFAEHEGLELVQ